MDRGPEGIQSRKRSRINDAAIGARIRELRNKENLSLVTVAGKLGISYQQLQKYESGSNRISGGRLQELAEILEVPVREFFIPAAHSEPDALSRDAVINAQAREIATYFLKIKVRALRQEALNFVASLVNRKSS